MTGNNYNNKPIKKNKMCASKDKIKVKTHDCSTVEQSSNKKDSLGRENVHTLILNGLMLINNEEEL